MSNLYKPINNNYNVDKGYNMLKKMNMNNKNIAILTIVVLSILLYIIFVAPKLTKGMAGMFDNMFFVLVWLILIIFASQYSFTVALLLALALVFSLMTMMKHKNKDGVEKVIYGENIDQSTFQGDPSIYIDNYDEQMMNMDNIPNHLPRFANNMDTMAERYVDYATMPSDNESQYSKMSVMNDNMLNQDMTNEQYNERIGDIIYPQVAKFDPSVYEEKKIRGDIIGYDSKAAYAALD